MSLEKYNPIVGVRKNEDGSLDYSRSAEMISSVKENPLFEKDEATNLLGRLRTTSEFERAFIISQVSKEKKVSKDDILKNLKELAKENIYFPEKVTHYHRTSFENFKSILKMGKLLSRSNLKKLNPDIKIPNWSASDNVMMTRDIYNKDGQLREAGISAHKVGASGGGVTLVFGEKIMSLDNYDAIGTYPTVSDASLAENCEAVLVESENNVSVIKDLLNSNNISIPVYIESEWLNSKYANN